MLEGKNLMFVRAELIEGTSNKTGKHFSICNITLSDEIESFKLDLDKEVIADMAQFQKGDKVNLLIDIIPRYNNNQFLVTHVMAAN